MNDTSIRYSRHISLPGFGEDGQRRLGRSQVMIVGLGGLGSPASLYLASSGIGRLLLNDFDRVDTTNLPRQILFHAEDIGRFKTEAAADRLRTVGADLACTEINKRLTESEIRAAAADCDAVLDCTDNFATRMMINQACVSTGTPLISGAAIRFEGQVSVFRNRKPGGPCYRCLYDEEDENLENCAGQGILAPLAGTIGCMMATETLKILAGLDSDLDGNLWAWDGLGGSTRLLAIKPKPGCPVCGT